MAGGQRVAGSNPASPTNPFNLPIFVLAALAGALLGSAGPATDSALLDCIAEMARQRV